MYRFKLSLQFFQLSSSKYLRSRPFSTSFENVGTMACHLKSRSVIRFRGPDTVKFLQGLVTNDVQKFSDAAVAEAPNSYPLPTPNLSMTVVPPIYAAFLTPQGRFLYDMFLYRPPRPDEKLDDTGSGPGQSPEEFELFADVDKSSSDELLQTLNKYRLRSKVDIESVADDFSCWQQFGWNLGMKSTSSTEEGVSASAGWGGGIDSVGISSSLGSKGGWQWNKDPRLDCLGYRGIFPSDAQPPAVAADEETGEENYLRWRFEKGVAEGPEEIPKGEAIPLEYNLAGLNAISFDKGCYVGQELVARTHHVGVIRKRLFPLKLSNDGGNDAENKVAPKAIIIDSGSQKKVGTVNTAVGSQGLGLLRLEEAFKSSGSLIIQGQKDVKVEFFVPEWWPTNWYKDYHRQSAAA